MGSTTAKEYYRRRLPHYQPADATFFVTFRLSGSLPDETIVLPKQEHEALEKKLQLVSGKAERKKLLKQSQQQYFGRFDEYLDKISTGPKWLAQPKIAKLVAEAMHYRNEKDYDLLAYCIMPNHVHIVFSLVTSSEQPIIETVGRLAESPELRDGVSHYIITNIMEISRSTPPYAPTAFSTAAVRFGNMKAMTTSSAMTANWNT